MLSALILGFAFGMTMGWLIPQPAWFGTLMDKLRAWLKKD